IELADDDRVASFTAFDPDNLDAAVAELDQRYLVGEGAPYAEMLELLYRGNAADNARDWTAMAECYAPAVVLVDRVRGGWGWRPGRDQALGVLPQLTTGRAIMRSVPACSERAVVYTLAIGPADDDVEAGFTVLLRRAGDRLSHMEVFGPDELDDALDAFNHL